MTAEVLVESGPAVSRHDSDDALRDEASPDASTAARAPAGEPASPSPRAAEATEVATTVEAASPTVDTTETQPAPATSEPADDDADLGSGESEVTRPQATRPAADPPRAGRQISGVDLIPVDCGADASVGSCAPPPECASSTADEPCVQAQEPPDVRPFGTTSLGEYQRNVFVPSGSVVDIYFDQRRPREEMIGLCRGMNGSFQVRGDDGSRWAGWAYCSRVRG